MTWRPMATAPKDGRLVLLSVGGRIVVGRSVLAGRRILGIRNWYHTDLGPQVPDRWQPLPAAWKPQTKKG